MLEIFTRLFSKQIWEHAKILLVGAVLCLAERTVTAVLRVMGLSGEKHFQSYHRVLNRAVWSSLEVSYPLLGLSINAFIIRGLEVLELVDMIERRRGAKIKAKWIYQDSVHPTQPLPEGHRDDVVKASGLRWLSLMLLAPVAWAKQVWALPFPTVLTPSEQYYIGKIRIHTLTLAGGAREKLT